MNFSEAMEAKGLTDSSAAAQLGVSAEAVRLWRHGDRKPTPDRARVIESVLGIPKHIVRPDLWDAPQEAA